MHLWINWIMHTPTHMRFIECFEVQDVIKQIDFGDFKTSVIYIYACSRESYIFCRKQFINHQR